MALLFKMLTISGGEGAVNNNENFILPPNFYCFHTNRNKFDTLLTFLCVHIFTFFPIPIGSNRHPSGRGRVGYRPIYSYTIHICTVIFMVFLLRLCSYFYRLVLPSTTQLTYTVKRSLCIQYIQ